MKKKRKIDFILYEDDDYKIVFRFYPRLSSCHSSGDEPPKNWGGVYKTYYYYKIIKTYKDEDGYFHKILFDSSCDECSIIREVAVRLKHLSEGKKKVEVNYRDDTWTVKLLDTDIRTFADCVWWKISEWKKGKNGSYKFELFRYDDIGYRFWLTKERAYEFGEYLNECCEYMLTHGDPI